MANKNQTFLEKSVTVAARGSYESFPQTLLHGRNEVERGNSAGGHPRGGAPKQWGATFRIKHSASR